MEQLTGVKMPGPNLNKSHNSYKDQQHFSGKVAKG